MPPPLPPQGTRIMALDEVVRLGQARLGQARLGQIGLDWVRLRQVTLGYARLRQVRLGQIGLSYRLYKNSKSSFYIRSSHFLRHQRRLSRRFFYPCSKSTKMSSSYIMEPLKGPSRHLELFLSTKRIVLFLPMFYFSRGGGCGRAVEPSPEIVGLNPGYWSFFISCETFKGLL